MTSQVSENKVYFVICERLHENGEPVKSILSSYDDECFVFVDGDEDCFDPSDLLKFENYSEALEIVNMAWERNQTYLGVAIWETGYPEFVDTRYVNAGQEKNIQVKANREAP